MGTNRRGRKFKEAIFFLSENIDNTHAAALLFFHGLYVENQITSENVHTLWDSRNNTIRVRFVFKFQFVSLNDLGKLLNLSGPQSPPL